MSNNDTPPTSQFSLRSLIIQSQQSQSQSQLTQDDNNENNIQATTSSSSSRRVDNTLHSSSSRALQALQSPHVSNKYVSDGSSSSSDDDEYQIFTSLYMNDDDGEFYNNNNQIIDSHVYTNTNNIINDSNSINTGSVNESQVILKGPFFKAPSSHIINQLSEADIIEIRIEGLGRIKNDQDTKKRLNELQASLQYIHTSLPSIPIALNVDSSSASSTSLAMILKLSHNLNLPIARVHFDSSILSNQAMRKIQKDSILSNKNKVGDNKNINYVGSYSTLIDTTFNSMRLTALDCFARVKPDAMR